jgi:vacuolar-type H+-ATPase subunit B/Vma2
VIILMSQGRVVKISGPLVIADGMKEADMFDVVRVSEQGLIGEIIEMRGEMASSIVFASIIFSALSRVSICFSMLFTLEAECK